MLSRGWAEVGEHRGGSSSPRVLVWGGGNALVTLTLCGALVETNT